jgi:hypothetical protein
MSYPIEDEDLCSTCQEINNHEHMCQPCRLKCRIFDLKEYNRGLEEDNLILKTEIEKTFTEWECLKELNVSYNKTISDLRGCLAEQRKEITELQAKLDAATKRVNIASQLSVSQFGDLIDKLPHLNPPKEKYSRGSLITPRTPTIKDSDLEEALRMFHARKEDDREYILNRDSDVYDEIDDIIANMK